MNTLQKLHLLVPLHLYFLLPLFSEFTGCPLNLFNGGWGPWTCGV